MSRKVSSVKISRIKRVTKCDDINVCSETYDFSFGSTRSKREFKSIPNNKKRKLIMIKNEKKNIKKKQIDKIDVEKPTKKRRVEVKNSLEIVSKSQKFKELCETDPEKLMALDEMSPNGSSCILTDLHSMLKLPQYTKLSLSFDPWYIFGDSDDLFIDDFE